MAPNAGYPEQFNKDGSHDLTRVATVRELPGFPVRQPQPGRPAACKEHLGEAAKHDRRHGGPVTGWHGSPARLVQSYIYDGNWKLQTENGADGYHVSAVHWNYAATTKHRQGSRSRWTMCVR